MLKHAYGWIKRTIFGATEDSKTAYPYRCKHCQEFNKAYSDPPTDEIDRKLTVACPKCGKANRLTLPLVTEEGAEADNAEPTK